MERKRTLAPREIFEANGLDISFVIPVLAINFRLATRVSYTFPFLLMYPLVAAVA